MGIFRFFICLFLLSLGNSIVYALDNGTFTYEVFEDGVQITGFNPSQCEPVFETYSLELLNSFYSNIVQDGDKYIVQGESGYGLIVKNLPPLNLSHGASITFTASSPQEDPIELIFTLLTLPEPFMVENLESVIINSSTSTEYTVEIPPFPHFVYDSISVQVINADAEVNISNLSLTIPSKNDCGVVDIPAEINGRRVFAIGDNAFHNIGLYEINIPVGIVMIGMEAFTANLLQEVVIPMGVEQIGRGAFSLNQIEYFSIPYTVDEFDHLLFNNNNPKVLFEGQPPDPFNFNDTGADIFYCAGTNGWSDFTYTRFDLETGETVVAPQLDISCDSDSDGILNTNDAFPFDKTKSIQNNSLFSSWDFDNDESVDALTDGLLLIKYAFALRGNTLMRGILSNTPSITSYEIEERLLIASQSFADIDANGSVDALTDGLIILRYLFNLRGDSLVNGAIGENAMRTDAADIEAYIQSLMPDF